MKITQTVFEFTPDDLRSISPGTIRKMISATEEPVQPQSALNPVAQAANKLGMGNSLPPVDVAVIPESLPAGEEPVTISGSSGPGWKFRLYLFAQRANKYVAVLAGVLLGLLILRYALRIKPPDFSGVQPQAEDVVPESDEEPPIKTDDPEFNLDPENNPQHKGMNLIPQTFPIEK